MKTSTDLRDRGLVAIVGAGPGGLTLARLLQTRGFNVRIFERDATSTARAQGGSLDLRPDSGQRAIFAAGLMEAFESVSRDHAKVFKLMDSNGDAIPTGGEAAAGGDTHEDAGPEIDRGDLRHLLLESLAPGTVSWDHCLNDVTEEADGRWRLDFAGRPPVVADLVVGADGIGSKVRARLTTVQPTYVGHTMLAANIRRDLWRGSNISDVVGEGSVMFAGAGKTIFVQRCNNDLILLYFSMKMPFDPSSAPAADDKDAALVAIADAYRDWSPDLLAMLTQIEGKVQRWPLSVMPPEYRWTPQVGLTMLGDAAHAMPPFTGKGVNLALLDALELADSLSGDTTEVSNAVHSFEAGMQARSVREIGACLEVGRMFYGIDLDFGVKLAA